MATQRKQAEAFILKHIDALVPGGPTVGIYQDLFKEMSDADFATYMADLASGKTHLVFYAPNLAGHGLSVERNLALAETLGHSFFKRLWIGKQGNTPAYLTPIKYLVVDLPIRRASQLLTKKIKIPEHSKTVDMLTGQPTGVSKGSRVTFEEVRLMAAMGLDNCLVELMKYRGGDLRGGNALNAMIARYGTANLKTLNNFASGVESTRTLSTFLKAMHLQSTL